MMTEEVRVLEDYYVIGLTMPKKLSTRGVADVPRDVYFKADRYSDYGGRLQVEWYAQQAQHFKTEKGARSAVTRLLEKGTIRKEHGPRVVRYTETVTRRYEIMEPAMIAAE